MAIDSLQMLDIIEVMENFPEIRRPPKHLRGQVDLTYRVEDQSVLILELRPRWDKPEEIRESSIAKAPYVKEKNHWKIFWFRASLRWEPYGTKPTVTNLRDFAKIVHEDKDRCFFG